MAKEMFIAASPHETKVAVLEDDQLVEVYFERDTDVGLVGGIYKGRVSRVLPGMQSAFVDIGLERDAFLYVSDYFFEDQEEYEKVFDEAEARATKLVTEESRQAPTAAPAAVEAPPPPAAVVETPPAPAPVAAEPIPAEVRPAEPAAPTPPPAQGVAPASPQGVESRDHRRFDGRGRRRRRRGGRGFERGPRRFDERKFPPRQEAPTTPHTFEVLPGESLAKYSHASHEAGGNFAPIGTTQPASEVPLPEEVVEGGATPFPATPGSEATSTDSAAVSLPETLPDRSEQTAPQDEQHFSPQPVIETSEVTTAASPELPAEQPALTMEYFSQEPPATRISEPDSPNSEFVHSEQIPHAPGVDSSFAEEPFEETQDEAEEEAPAETPAAYSEQSPEGVPEGGAGYEPAPEAAIANPESEPSAAATPGVETPGSVTASSSDAPPAGGERSYTLREPHQRPRFAPRRGRRGRRGMRGGAGKPEPRREHSRPGNHQPMQIAELLKEGQEILVQIAKEPLGTKGARITSHIALPGRYLVYMPTIDHIGVSRKIASEEERLRLRNIILENKGPLTGGFIVRTAGQGRSEEEFKADLRFLSKLWSDIRSKSDKAKAPALIHRDLDLVQRLMRDIFTPEFKSVRVDNEVEYERVLEFVNRSQPALVGKVKLYTRDTPLFEEFGVQQEIEKALKPKVWLKSGGYIVINQTEALVAIDVNTGKYVGRTNRLEDTILKTNIDAVNEIVRQIRLRDLGGIIVVDFIDMDERKNRARVVQALEDALRHDRAPTKVISFHDFGLVAITRKRVKQSLERTLCEPCHYCTGAGWIKSVNSVCYEILSEARKMAKQIEGDAITLRVSPEVAKALKSREGILISELESLTHKDIIVKSDPTVHQEQFQIF